MLDTFGFGQHAGFFHRVQDFAVQELVVQLRVEALAVTVLEIYTPYLRLIPALMMRRKSSYPINGRDGISKQKRCRGGIPTP